MAADAGLTSAGGDGGKEDGGGGEGESGKDSGEPVAEGESTAVFVSPLHVTPLFPPWASQLPLLFVVLHATVPSVKQTNSAAILT